MQVLPASSFVDGVTLASSWAVADLVLLGMLASSLLAPSLLDVSSIAVGRFPVVAQHWPDGKLLASTAFGLVDELLGLSREYQRDAWEVYYMYVVSLLGAIWVGIRVLEYWRLDPERWRFVPLQHRSRQSSASNRGRSATSEPRSTEPERSHVESAETPNGELSADAREPSEV